VSAVTIDCVDPQRVARFWSALLGREPGPSQDGWVYLGHRGDPQPRLVFQPVPEPKATSLGGRNTARGSGGQLLPARRREP
jgi:Glyoxalase-like domain